MHASNTLEPRMRVETDINRVVTPMLDMTFQLLFFFVINFHAPRGEGQLDLKLSAEGHNEQKKSIEPIDDQPDEFLISAYSQSGSLDLLTFRFKQFEPESLPKEDVLGELRTRLKAIPKPGPRYKPSLKIECDRKLKYSELIQLMNLCREEGFQEIGIMPLR
jgi:biopolymer transport protein ExbD